MSTIHKYCECQCLDTNTHAIACIVDCEREHWHFSFSSLTADQRYSLQTWVMTPYGHPQTDLEKAYNQAHIRTRNIIEQSFGLLKARFRCLDISGGHLLYSPPLVCKMILVCAILHNICVRTNVPWDGDQQPLDTMEEEEESDDRDIVNNAAGPHRRIHIVQHFFT